VKTLRVLRTQREKGRRLKRLPSHGAVAPEQPGWTVVRRSDRKFKGMMPDPEAPLKRSPQTGRLIGQGRPRALGRIHALRDRIRFLRTYLRKRILSGAFEPIKDGSEIPKKDLRRLALWFQPFSGLKPSKTEVYYFNSRPLHKTKSGELKFPTSVFIPPDSHLARKEFYRSPFRALKKRIFIEMKFPAELLALLHWQSSTRASRQR
jgi:hypothetical protein